MVKKTIRITSTIEENLKTLSNQLEISETELIRQAIIKLLHPHFTPVTKFYKLNLKTGEMEFNHIENGWKNHPIPERNQFDKTALWRSEKAYLDLNKKVIKIHE